MTPNCLQHTIRRESLHPLSALSLSLPRLFGDAPRVTPGPSGAKRVCRERSGGKNGKDLEIEGEFVSKRRACPETGDEPADEALKFDNGSLICRRSRRPTRRVQDHSRCEGNGRRRLPRPRPSPRRRLQAKRRPGGVGGSRAEGSARLLEGKPEKPASSVSCGLVGRSRGGEEGRGGCQ